MDNKWRGHSKLSLDQEKKELFHKAKEGIIPLDSVLS